MRKIYKYLFPGFFGLLIYASVRIVNDTTSQEKFWEKPIGTNLIEITTVLIVGYIMQATLNYFERQFSKEKKQVTRKTILKEFITVFLACAVIVNLTIIPMAALTDDGLGLNDIAIVNIIPALYVLLYFAVIRGNYYLKAYVDNKIKLEKLASDKLQTELKFLKAQYHPHFLFNALNTVYFQMDESTDAAKKSIEKFSALLRYQLYDQQQTVPISQEIEYLKNFVELQQLRSSKRLQMEFSVDQRLNGQQVYPLLLLPLVENAFKYVGGEYQLSICAAVEGNYLHFRVRNSTPRDIPQRQKASGIGLENLRRRLELLYPEKHELKITRAEDQFDAELRIDLKENSI